MDKADKEQMKRDLREPGQMEIVEVADRFGFTATRYPRTGELDDPFARDGDWYFYSNQFFIGFCGDHWTVQDINRPHPDPINAGCDYIELKYGRGAADLAHALVQLGCSLKR